MPLSDLLIGDRIALLADPHDRAAVLGAAARLLADGRDDAYDIVHDSLTRREALGSTGIGHGVALPHGRTELWDQPRAALLRLAHPVDFGASDGQPVDLVIAMAVPEHAREQHLLVLAEIAELFGDADFRDRLRAAESAQALGKALSARRKAGADA